MTSRFLTLPLVEKVIPGRHSLLKQAGLVAFGVLFIAALAQLRIQIGPVPITGQTLGVLLIGAGYGLRLGSFTALSYLLAGGLGLGIFQGGASGWAYLAGPTGGYLIGFVLAATLVGYLAQRGWDKRVSTTALAMLLGNLVIYAAGLLWLSRFAPDWTTTLQWGLIPFIPGDIIKLGLAAALLPFAWRLSGHR